MTVKELRYLVDNLDEYIHVPGGIERLKKTVLHLAVSGQLVPQDPSEGTGDELFQQIQAEKAKLIAAGKLKKQKPLPAITEFEIPFTIPKTWKWVRLGELTQKIGSGSTPRGGKNAYTASGPLFIRSQNVWNDGLSLVNIAHIKNEMHAKMSNTHVESEDVLLNITGASIGRTSIVPAGIGEANVSQHVSIVRLISQNHARMLHLIFTSSYFQKSIDNFQAGISREGLSKQNMEKMLIPLQPTPEQKRIFEKVDAIFVLIDELAEKYRTEQGEREKLVASTLTQLARGNGDLALTHLSEIIRTKADAAQLRKTILHLAVSGQLVPQDPSEGTGEELYQQIQAEKAKLIAAGKLKKQKPLPAITEFEIPFTIPKTWKWVRLGEASTYQQRGKSPEYAVKSKFPVISQKCVRTNHIDWSAIKYITENSIDKYEDFRILQSGDLLLNSTGTGTMGRVGIFSTNSDYDKVVADSHVTVIRFSGQVDPGFAHACFNAPYIQDDVESKASGSTNQIEWNLLSIQNELLPLPPLAEQTRIVQKTTQLLNLTTKLEPHLEK